MKLKTKLKKMLDETSNDLEKNVIDYILNYYNDDEEIKCFFSDLSISGCSGGMISSLIYYKDTHKFFDLYQGEIEELKEEMESSLGEPLNIKGDIKNWLAWFGFEEMAKHIANELNLDI